jgi:hypothetical protein
VDNIGWLQEYQSRVFFVFNELTSSVLGTVNTAEAQLGRIVILVESPTEADVLRHLPPSRCRHRETCRRKKLERRERPFGRG